MDDLTAARPGAWRWVPLSIILVGLGLVVFPSCAALLDRAAENVIIPAHVLAMVVLGAVAGRLLRAGLPPARAALGGAVMGFVASLVVVVVFFFLLNGFAGA